MFKVQTDFYDIPTSKLSPSEIRKKLADLAESTVKGVKSAEVLDLLTLKSTPNGGVAVTDDLKYTSTSPSPNGRSYFGANNRIVKVSRQNSIHVSPTVLFNGLVVPEVSSSWGEAEWKKFLADKVKA